MNIFDKALQRISREKTKRKLITEVKKEQKEHPWLSKKQARKIVADHHRRG